MKRAKQSPRRPSWIGLAALAGLGLLCSGAAAVAAEPGAGPLLAAEFSFRGYWHGFVEFWLGGLKKQEGVVLVALGVAAVTLFIITRGKWRK